MFTEHASERILERCADAGVSPDFVEERLAKALGRCKPTKSYAIRLVALPKAVGSYGERSNGDEVWAIVRSGIIQTVMLRRQGQTCTPSQFGVHEVRRNG